MLWPRWLATRASALVWLLASIYCAPAIAASWILEGRVVGVSDGDTITVLDDAKTQHKIRFAGIDAPEKGQAFGERSKQNLSALVFQKRVEARCHKKDRYGREVCAVFVSLRDVGLEQIRQGMAWHYKEYQHEQTTQDRLVYRDEEESAKAQRVGLWKDAKPVSGGPRARRLPDSTSRFATTGAGASRSFHGDPTYHARTALGRG